MTALAIPDPRTAPIPAGWLEHEAAPAILTETDWEALDEYEARLRAFASYIASFDGDAVEYEKALRLVEKRRGDLLDGDLDGSARGPDESKASKDRWRKISRAWDRVWPFLLDATDHHAVTQRAILRFIEDPMSVHYSSLTAEWSTPQDLFDLLAEEFPFALDVCATAGNTKCAAFFDAELDGLAQPWSGVCWMNPPYGEVIGKWVRKASDSAAAGATVVCLLPARVDTRWWWDYCRYGEIRFLRGRLKFGGVENSAPFPSAVVIFGRPEKVVWWER